MSNSNKSIWNGNLFGSLLLSYLSAFGLLGALFYFGDAWYIVANSRILRLLIGGGVVRYHDAHSGFIDGIPDPEYYLLAMEPVSWAVAGFGFALILVYWAVRALQFHSFARFSGIAGDLGDHARAFFYGTGVSKLIPFGGDTLAIQEALDSSPESSRKVEGLQGSFRAVEIFFFGLISLVLVGWNMWFKQLGSTLIFLGCISYLVHGGVRSQLRSYLSNSWATLRSLPQSTLLGFFATSVLAFQLIDWASYFIAMAFTTVNVVIGVDAQVMTMAIVCAYIARSIPFTPGGFGQFEWGLSLGIWFGGSSLPQAATIAILVSLFRFVAILILTLGVRIFFPVKTNLRSVLGRLSERST